jgi:ABC-type sugar transport system permease subunit
VIYDRASDLSSVVFGLPLSAVLRSRLAREAFWTVVLKSANTLLGFVTTVLLARLLGAEGYGIYAYALALVSLLAMPAHAGLPNLVLRETARGMAEACPDDPVRAVAPRPLRMVGACGPGI